MSLLAVLHRWVAEMLMGRVLVVPLRLVVTERGISGIAVSLLEAEVYGLFG